MFLTLADNWNNLDRNEVENDVMMEEYGENGYYENQNVAMVFDPGDQQPPIEQPKRYLTLDTNVWINRYSWIKHRVVQTQENHNVSLFVPVKVLRELEGLKSPQNEDIWTMRKAKNALRFILRLARQKRIKIQNNREFYLVNRRFPTRDLADNNIIESVLILKRRGLDVAMSTMDVGMKILCYANGIDLIEPGGPNYPKNHG